MTVRRLAEKQPHGFAFSPNNQAWAAREIAKYPEGRQASAVISLLWRAQEQEGWVTEPAIEVVAAMLDMPKIRVLEVATFYTMFHLEPVGRIAHIQVCGTTPCWLRGSDAIKDVCRQRIHHDQFALSDDRNFSWEEVECLGACVNAPLVQINADTYEDLTAETFAKLLDDLADGRPVKPGPQLARQFSAPEGGPTSLTDDAIYAPRPSAADPVTPLTDGDAKKPSEDASVRESPAPKAPLKANPEDKKPDPVSKV
jgi:NADH-quinone oxidoreductase subunit E